MTVKSQTERGLIQLHFVYESRNPSKVIERVRVTQNGKCRHSSANDSKHKNTPTPQNIIIRVKGNPKTMGKRTRELERERERIESIKKIALGTISLPVLNSCEFWNDLGERMHLSVNDQKRNEFLSIVKCEKGIEYAFGIEEEGIVEEELKEHYRRLCQDGFTKMQICETAKENQLFDRLEDVERMTAWQKECKNIEDFVEWVHASSDSGQVNPTWLLVYDNFWLLAQRVEQIVRRVSNGNRMNFDALIWRVDEANNTAFTPHRDRQPKTSVQLKNSFRRRTDDDDDDDDDNNNNNNNDEPKYCTMWIPFTNATCDNSCLYVIPRWADPGYSNGDDDEDMIKTPLEKALPDKQSYQNITALPVDVGEAVIFSHRVIHWGSKPRPNQSNGQPRINVSFGFSDDSFEKPYLLPKKYSAAAVNDDDDDDDNIDDDDEENSQKKKKKKNTNIELPTLKERLALIGSQLIVYHERFPPKNFKALKLLKKLHDAGKNFLDADYKKIVEIEYVRATSLLAGKNKDDENVDDDDDDDYSSDDEEKELDNALDKMLDAKSKGNGDDYEDDYEEDEEDDFADDPNPDDYSDTDPGRPYIVTEDDLFFGNASEEEILRAKNKKRREMGEEEIPIPAAREATHVDFAQEMRKQFEKPENKEETDLLKKILNIVE